MTARERLDTLFDPGSFVELERFRTSESLVDGPVEEAGLGDGVVVGYGLVDGRQVFAFADDFTVRRGSIGAAHASKVARILTLAAQIGAPLVGLVDSEGPRVEDGVAALAGISEVALQATHASGVVPMIALLMGPCQGAGTYFPSLADVVIMVDGTSHITVTPAGMTRHVTREDVSSSQLGGARIHGERSGVSHLTAPDDQAAIDAARYVLSLLPSNNAEEPERGEVLDDPGRRSKELANIIPTNLTKPYDVREVVREVVDQGSVIELSEGFAANIVIAMARMAGRVVGVVANQPAVLAGTLDAKACRKAARFVRFCDCFNIPLVTFVDVPGFFPGRDQEHRGLVRAAGKLLYAFAEATVPKVTVVTRKAYGSAFVAMGSKSRSDMTFAYPTAEISVLDPDTAVRELAKPEGELSDAVITERIAAYRNSVANPYVASQRGLVDEVIPAEITRPRVIRALEMLASKRQSSPPRKHGNIPL
jgi:propionyl-CoA carboxylase beta chain